MGYFYLFSLCGLVVILYYTIKRLAKAGVKSIKQGKNPYIKRHKLLKVDNDSYYKDYLEWCYLVNEIPTSKEIFLKEVEESERNFKNLIS